MIDGRIIASQPGRDASVRSNFTFRRCCGRLIYSHRAYFHVLGRYSLPVAKRRQGVAVFLWLHHSSLLINGFLFSVPDSIQLCVRHAHLSSNGRRPPRCCDVRTFRCIPCRGVRLHASDCSWADIRWPISNDFLSVFGIAIWRQTLNVNRVTEHGDAWSRRFSVSRLLWYAGGVAVLLCIIFAVPQRLASMSAAAFLAIVLIRFLTTAVPTTAAIRFLMSMLLAWQFAMAENVSHHTQPDYFPSMHSGECCGLSFALLLTSLVELCCRLFELTSRSWPPRQ